MTPDEESDIVEKVVERAAEKAAAASAQPTTRGVSIGEVSWFVVLAVLNLGAIGFSLQNRNEGRDRQKDFQVVCQVLARQNPDYAVELARCVE